MLFPLTALFDPLNKLNKEFRKKKCQKGTQQSQ